jgi:cytochrome c
MTADPPDTPCATPVRRGLLVRAAAGLAALGLVWGVAVGAPADPPEMKQAIERGHVLFTQPWAEGAKACSACHAGGRNKLTGARVNEYPKYDRAMKRVVSGQQKINQMIETKSGGVPLELGSDDLNALEAYIKSIGG